MIIYVDCDRTRILDNFTIVDTIGKIGEID